MNRITNAERNKIRARARELIQAGEQNVDVEARLIQEFGISRERARQAWGYTSAVMRGEAIRGQGRPPVYREEMVQLSIRITQEQSAWLSLHGGASEKIRELLAQAMRLP